MLLGYDFSHRQALVSSLQLLVIVSRLFWCRRLLCSLWLHRILDEHRFILLGSYLVRLQRMFDKKAARWLGSERFNHVQIELGLLNRHNFGVVRGHTSLV